MPPFPGRTTIGTAANERHSPANGRGHCAAAEPPRQRKRPSQPEPETVRRMCGRNRWRCNGGAAGTAGGAMETPGGGQDKSDLRHAVRPSIFEPLAQSPRERTMRSAGGTAPGRRTRPPGTKFQDGGDDTQNCRFYRDGFRGMTVGRTLWCIKAAQAAAVRRAAPPFFRAIRWRAAASRSAAQRCWSG